MKEGWQKINLGDAIKQLRTGLNPRVHFQLNTEDAKGYYITVRELKGFDFAVDGKTDRINKAALKRINERSNLQIGDVLYSGTGTIGRTAIVKELPTWWNIKEGVYAITPLETLNSKYLVYQTMSDEFMKQVMAKASGATVKSIPMRELVKVKITLPSLSEQQRIVEYLDSSFAKIDAVKAKAKENLDNAQVLFQAALTDAMTPKEGWEENTLGEVSEIIRGKRFVRTDIVENGVPCIHYGDIYTHYGLSAEKTKGCISLELAKKMRFANKNDVVVVQAGENPWDIGVGVAYFGDEPAAVHDACFILKHNQNPMFVSYYLRSYKYHVYLLDYVHEGKICSFLKPALVNAPFPHPSLAEQEKIVSQLDSIFEKVNQLKDNYKIISTHCESLKQSLLRQVFE